MCEYIWLKLNLMTKCKQLQQIRYSQIGIRDKMQSFSRGVYIERPINRLVNEWDFSRFTRVHRPFLREFTFRTVIGTIAGIKFLRYSDRDWTSSSSRDESYIRLGGTNPIVTFIVLIDFDRSSLPATIFLPDICVSLRSRCCERLYGFARLNTSSYI